MKIAISYRDEAYGKAAFFDHFTLRTMTGTETVICKSNRISTIHIANYIHLRGAEKNKYPLPISADIPETVNDWGESSGFIFIPGYTRKSDDTKPNSHQERLAYEHILINKARVRGQPVLAVCAGSWTLWEAFGGVTKAVTDHNYGGAMPRLSTINPEVCNNKMIHKVVPAEHTYLSGAANGCTPFAVNSVHWKAPDVASPEAHKFLQVCAQSQKDDDLAPNSRQGNIMQPEDCIEAFETTCGVPMLGIQWHPEAFNPGEAEAKKHQAIFSFITGAGRTYLNRRRLNEEFNQKTGHPKISFFAKETRDLSALSTKIDIDYSK